MIDDKVVVVTGSSRGIGKAIAELFALSGANVVINSYNNYEQLLDTERYLNSISTRSVMSVRADVSNYSDVKLMIDNVISRFATIDILINNAGISNIGLFSDMLPKQWEYLTKVNLFSVFNCTHAVLPCFISKKEGVIVNISSIWGVNGASCEAVYSATKGAINSFTKAIARELAPSNIRVNSIACGVIDTDMNSILSEAEKNQLMEQIPLMRFGTPLDVAQLALFLSSDKSNFLTGQIITLDGGMI